jgi:hypothetical protein
MFYHFSISTDGLRRAGLAIILVCLAVSSPAQLPDTASTVRGIDTSVAARDENVAGYTVTEHYAVFRNQDQEHPAAEMTVRTTYRKDIGKSYEVLQRSGSELIQKEVLDRVLENERTLTAPANRPTAVITSKNYAMNVTGAVVLNGRNCLMIAIEPRRTTPYLFKGIIWVDAQSYAIVQLEGVAAKSPSMLTDAPRVFRQYEQIDGFPMATHARAITNSWLVGQSTVKIDYTGYQIELRSADRQTSRSAAPVTTAEQQQ